MDLRELYQQVILDHNRSPKNYGRPAGANRSAEGTNPLCGDHYTIHLGVAPDGRVTAVGFEGDGCAISKASASLMTEAIRGKPRAEVERLFERVHGVLTAPAGTPSDAALLDELGGIAALEGVRQFPMRVKCASLAWHAMKAALNGEDDAVSTE